MKKLIAVMLICITSVFLFLSFYGDKVAEAKESNASLILLNSSNYSIRILSPEVIRVIGLKGRRDEASLYGYGECFDKAIAEIVQKYKILQIAPVDYRYNDSSVTKELFIIVEPKEG